MLINKNIKNGYYEIVSALKMQSNWMYLGTQDIRLKYRRSTFGPFWVTISTSIFIGALSLLWSSIILTDLRTFLPYFAIGQIMWLWVSGQILESSIGFSQFESSIKQIKLPFPIYILRLCTKNFIIFLHNFLIILVIVSIIYPSNLTLACLLFLPALVLIQLITFSSCLILGIICTRYRDLTQIVTSLMQLIFFFTPILWTINNLGRNAWIANYNPFYHFISILRLPLLGQYPTLDNWIWTLASTILLFTLAAILLGKFSNRIAYWI